MPRSAQTPPRLPIDGVLLPHLGESANIRYLPMDPEGYTKVIEEFLRKHCDKIVNDRHEMFIKHVNVLFSSGKSRRGKQGKSMQNSNSVFWLPDMRKGCSEFGDLRNTMVNQLFSSGKLRRGKLAQRILNFPYLRPICNSNAHELTISGF